MTKEILLWLLCLSSLISAGQTGSDDVDRQVLENEKKANVYLEEGKKNAAAQLYTQSAYLLRGANRPDESAVYYQKVLEINTSLGNTRGQMISHNSLALVFLESENYEKAVFHLNKELEYRREIKNKQEIVNVLTNLALAENELSHFEVAMANVDEAIVLSKELNDFSLLRRCYGIAYDIFEKKGDTKKSKEFLELYSALDRKLKEQKLNRITSEANRIVSKAHTEKQLTEKQLTETSKALEKTVTTLQEAEELTREQKLTIDLEQAKNNELNALNEATRLRMRSVLIGTSFLALFVIVLSFMIIKIRRANKKINEQRLSLQKQNKEIRASIRYANTIQQAILPAQKEIEEYFDTFIIYLPKDIVSGDFYWFTVQDNKDKMPVIYFAVVDCTGHGVPGAFMSMIGNRLLNEIVNEKMVSAPSRILGELNLMVRSALHQEETDNNDGMDLSLCKFEKGTGNKTRLTYAGAKRPLYIVKNNEEEIFCHGGDRKSIGGYNLSKREIKFTDFEIEVGKGDMIYLFSDGIVDQNNSERKKYGRVRLEEAMKNYAKLRPAEQKDIIEQELREYMRNEEQRDDITLAGLKVIN